MPPALSELADDQADAGERRLQRTPAPLRDVVVALQVQQPEVGDCVQLHRQGLGPGVPDQVVVQPQLGQACRQHTGQPGRAPIADAIAGEAELLKVLRQPEAVWDRIHLDVVEVEEELPQVLGQAGEEHLGALVPDLVAVQEQCAQAGRQPRGHAGRALVADAIAAEAERLEARGQPGLLLDSLHADGVEVEGEALQRRRHEGAQQAHALVGEGHVSKLHELEPLRRELLGEAQRAVIPEGGVRECELLEVWQLRDGLDALRDLSADQRMLWRKSRLASDTRLWGSTGSSSLDSSSTSRELSSSSSSLGPSFVSSIGSSDSLGASESFGSFGDCHPSASLPELSAEAALGASESFRSVGAFHPSGYSPEDPTEAAWGALESVGSFDALRPCGRLPEPSAGAALGASASSGSFGAFRPSRCSSESSSDASCGFTLASVAPAGCSPATVRTRPSTGWPSSFSAFSSEGTFSTKVPCGCWQRQGSSSAL
eukprot:CAMPEP_0179062554 /NCGR_PEP_ID=MMETSP0796-20121207/26987_1 /TAXON_ID=73915 /ORGANISM="Pyrodinium bahamense, Strain pbaha01" /LENGTH=485 /DNA_ID=CAMNT_0020759463 /DNA_START=237 /DNA_END=1692 /DNA_ORIENTATION=-